MKNDVPALYYKAFSADQWNAKKNNKIMKMKRKGGNDEYAPNVKTTEEIENNSTIANLVQIGKLNFFTPYLVQYAMHSWWFRV